MKLIDNASSNISQGITLDSDSKADKYKISWNCSSIGSGKSYIRIYATLEDVSYRTYFLPIQFLGATEFEFAIDTSSTFLQFDMIGDATVTSITFETVTDATMEYVKANAGYWDRIKEITSDTGKVKTNMLEGLINMTLNAFANESGTITQEDGVMTFLNGTTVEDSTQAVQITGGAIRVANTKNADGSWNWTTAISGTGINAATIIADTFAGLNITSVNIVSGTITGGTISGVNIKGSEFVSTSDNSETTMKLTNGSLSFKSPNGESFIHHNDIALHGPNNSLINIHPDTQDLSYGSYGSKIVASGQNEFQIIQGNSQANIKFREDGNIYINAGYGGSGDIYLQPKTSDNFVYVMGALDTFGDKNAAVPTQHYGVRALYCEEADRSYFSTKGIAETVNGECIIELDPMFLETIELNNTCPYLIQLTPYSKANVYVEAVEDGRFIVRSDVDTRFAYDLKAIRISYANVYLKERKATNSMLKQVQEAAIKRMAGD